MKAYGSYFDRQTPSARLHRRLLALGEEAGEAGIAAPGRGKRAFGGSALKIGALAACAALLIGWGGLRRPAALMEPTAPAVGRPPAPAFSYPAEPETDQAAADFHGFVARGPEEEAKLAFPAIQFIDFAEATGEPQLAASIALPDGSFTVNLDKEAILKLFWGPGGKPEMDDPKLDTGDFPLMLMGWAGYTVAGRAIYDGSGGLWELKVWGEKGEDSFYLRAAPGHIPPTCLAKCGEQVTETEVLGAPVTAWYRSYDRDGDGVVEHVCTSQFMAGDVGVRFENVGSGGMRAGGDEAADLGGAILFNSMLVNQMLHADGGLYLDEVAHNDQIPAWAEVKLESLAQALAYEEFAPYLPREEPAGGGEFYGRYSYKEGVYDQLFVRWSRNYDDVEVEICLPEGETAFPEPVDVNVPASYDWRLYDGSISDSVPEEYRESFYKPAFRAEDMSLEVVKARGRRKDTGGMAYRFYVQHDNGVVVGYDCSGVSAEYVWSLVEAALG